MFFPDQTLLDLIVRSFALTVMAMIWVVLLVRVNGLRSFSKMTNFDFVMTVATGSLLAGAAQATAWAGFAQATLAMSALFLVQFVAARLRKDSEVMENILQNEPILLMRDGELIRPALEKTRVAESDVIAKLREANALDMKAVKAVVLETTGDISVLHGDGPLDERLIRDVRGPAV